jgi:DNA-3-methyladenine glycosylase I
MTEPIRCTWCLKDDLYKNYHDTEWGVPVHDDRKLFEMLTLEGAQAGLSWHTVLKKREHYREAFDNWDIKLISGYKQAKIDSLLTNEGIIRNKLKIHSTIKNAEAFIKIQKEFGSFDKYIWSFVNNKPVKNFWKEMKDIPAKTKVSDVMSKDLLQRGFKFVGSTICYAFMQATGMVDDHLTECWKRKM